MAIKSHTGPEKGRELMQQALAARTHQAATISTPLGGAPQSGAPVPVYLLRLDNIEADNPLAAAKLVSWQYPIIGGVHPGLADIRQDANGVATEFGGLSHGIIAQRFIEACFAADAQLRASVEEFQPRILDVPALQFAALWLHGKSDLFVPLLEGSPPGSASMRIVADVIPDLRRRVEARLRRTLNREPRGGSDPNATPTN